MPFTNITRVRSSQIRAVAHDPTTNTLPVHFKGGTGSVYHYFDVHPDHHTNLVAADSACAHLNEHIKKGGFQYKRLIGEEAAQAERELANVPELPEMEGWCKLTQTTRLTLYPAK